MIALLVACVFPGHIYHPARFEILGCETARGRVAIVRSEPDGDYHVRLDVDREYRHLLNVENREHQAGDLVVEEPCMHKVTQRDAREACEGYRSPFPRFKVGHRYEVRGNWVLDKPHGWNEIHGLVEMREIP